MKKLKRKLLFSLVGPAAALMKLLCLTYRYRFRNIEYYRTTADGQGAIVAFWHNRILGAMICPLFKSRRSVAVISDHFDGELITRIAARFGHGAARGSTRKRATQAIRELKAVLNSGDLVGITPDGPKGPRYHVHPGASYLARIAKRPVLPCVPIYQWRIRFSSWDRFELPLPFSRIDYLFGRPIYFDGDVESTRRKIEIEMRDLVREGEQAYRPGISEENL